MQANCKRVHLDILFACSSSDRVLCQDMTELSFRTVHVSAIFIGFCIYLIKTIKYLEEVYLLGVKVLRSSVYYYFSQRWSHQAIWRHTVKLLTITALIQPIYSVTILASSCRWELIYIWSFQIWIDGWAYHLDSPSHSQWKFTASKSIVYFGLIFYVQEVINYSKG